MSDFEKTFVLTNMPDGAVPYSKDTLAKALETLRASDKAFFEETPVFDCVALSVILCALRRADAVPGLFRQVTADMSKEDTKKAFEQVREAITIIFPFIGLPNTIPALLGMTPYIKERGIEVTKDTARPGLISDEDSEQGSKHFHTVYDAVGNMAVHDMLENYYPDVNFGLRTIVFGYLMKRANDFCFTAAQGQYIIASGITAMGAVRQAKSHIKGGIDMGVSPAAMKAMVEVATEFLPTEGQVTCNSKGKIDIDALTKEVRANRETLNNGGQLQ